jgi:hypothetical protein
MRINWAIEQRIKKQYQQTHGVTSFISTCLFLYRTPWLKQTDKKNQRFCQGDFVQWYWRREGMIALYPVSITMGYMVERVRIKRNMPPLVFSYWPVPTWLQHILLFCGCCPFLRLTRVPRVRGENTKT